MPTPNSTNRIPEGVDSPARGHRNAMVLAETWEAGDNSVEVEFSTGADCIKADWRTYPPTLYVERLPLSGMDFSEINAGAHVLRQHRTSVEDVIGSCVPDSGRLETRDGTEAAVARVRLSQEPSDAELVNKIRTKIVRKWSYGYEKIGEPTISKDPETGMEIREWAAHRPYELSPVGVPADAFTNTRAGEEPPASAEEPGTQQDTPARVAANTEDQRMKTPEQIEQERVEAERKAAEERAAQERREAEIRAKALEEGQAAEAARRNEVLGYAYKAYLTEADEVVKAILADPKVDATAARLRIADRVVALAERAGGPVAGHVVLGAEERDHRMAGMVEALAAKADPRHRTKITEVGRPYANFRLRDFARECLRAAGHRNPEGLGDQDLFDLALGSRAGAQGTGDFSALLANTVNKNFVNAFAQEAPNFEGITTRRLVNDFKPVTEIRLGAFAALDEIPESGEIKFGSLTEGSETWALASFGKGWRITRKALINDDLDAFGTVPDRMAQAVIRTMLNTFWAMVAANPKLADGKAVFHADHANLTASSGAVPDVDQIQKGRQMLMEQTDLGGAPLSLKATHLVVPPSCLSATDKLLTTIFPNQASAVTPLAIRDLQVVVEPRLKGSTAWYLFAAEWPSLVVGYLQGQEAPRFRSWESDGYQGMEFRIEHDFGCAWTDYRGAYKNKGAA